MKKIPLTQGQFALVDDEDYGELSKFKWHASSGKNRSSYALRVVGASKQQKRVYMHRYLANTPDGLITDHIDGNSLNNQRSNLRIVTVSQNQMNTKLNVRNKSGFKGVAWNKQNKRFEASVWVNGKNKHLGNFLTAEAAHEAYKVAAKELFGEYFRAK